MPESLKHLALFAFLAFVLYGTGVGMTTIVGTIGVALNWYEFENLYYYSMIIGVPIGIALFWILDRQ